MKQEPIRSNGNPARQLSERRMRVLALIAARQSIKQIARELDVSVSAVNQHIKALKSTFAVNSLSELSRIYKDLDRASAEADCTKNACIKSQLPADQPVIDSRAQEFIAPVSEFRDSLAYTVPAPWETWTERDEFPGVLNGANAVWLRGALIVGIALGLFALVLVGLGVAQGVTSALNGSEAVSRTL